MVAKFAVGAVTVILLASLSLAYQPARAQDEPPAYQLLILEPNWMTLNLGYDAEQAFAALQSADYAAPLFTLELSDLESYQWDWQALTLTEDATQRLVDAKVDLEYQPDMQKLLDLQESMGMGNPLELALYNQPFVVLVDGEFLYGGIFLDAMSQMAINYPVIRVELVEGKATFNILPTHIPFVNYDPLPRENAPLDDAFTPILDQDRASAPDFFQDAVEGWSTSDSSTYFREFIRDEHLREIVEGAGILTSAPEGE